MLNSDGTWQEIANPRLGEGPSSAPPCPGPNFVWVQGSWRQVVSRRPYAAVAAQSGQTPAAAPAAVAAATAAAALARAAAAPPAPQAPPQGRTPHNSRRSRMRGYQVLLWGPRRSSTTIPQVRLALKDLLQGQVGLPADLAAGSGTWLGQHALLFDLSAPVVQRLTAGRVGALKYHIRQRMHWRTVFLFSGNVVTSAPEAYRALEQNIRAKVLYFTRELPCHPNRFAALEPAAVWCEDTALDTFSSDSDPDSPPASPGAEQQRQQQRPPGRQQQQQQRQQQRPAGQQQPAGQQRQQQPASQQQQQRPADQQQRQDGRRPVQPVRGLRLGVLNPTHMPRQGQRLGEISQLLRQFNLDIVGFPETHETDHDRLPQNLISNYKFYSKARVGGLGGGVGVAVHSCLSQQVKPFVFRQQQYAEAFWLVMQRTGSYSRIFSGWLHGGQWW